MTCQQERISGGCPLPNPVKIDNFRSLTVPPSYRIYDQGETGHFLDLAVPLAQWSLNLMQTLVPEMAGFCRWRLP